MDINLQKSGGEPERRRLFSRGIRARQWAGWLILGMAQAADPGSPNALPHGLRGLVEIPDPWRWLRVSGLGLLVAVVCGLGFWLWWRRRQVTDAPPGALPDDVARARLQRALVLIDQPQPFVAEVSESVRAYLEARFGLRAPERTTEEFIEELRTNGALAGDHRDALGTFLGTCDMVKFAGVRPGRFELEELHLAALKLVNELTPAARPTVPPALPPVLDSIAQQSRTLPVRPINEGTGS